MAWPTAAEGGRVGWAPTPFPTEAEHYAATEHNHYTRLRAQVETLGRQGLVFSVLLTMDIHSTIARESFFKRPLGTRLFGLNEN